MKPKRLHSILQVTSYKGYETVIVVCETLNDETEVIEMADRTGDKVTNITTAEHSGVFLNGYEFIDG